MSQHESPGREESCCYFSVIKLVKKFLEFIVLLVHQGFVTVWRRKRDTSRMSLLKILLQVLLLMFRLNSIHLHFAVCCSLFFTLMIDLRASPSSSFWRSGRVQVHKGNTATLWIRAHTALSFFFFFFLGVSCRHHVTTNTSRAAC